MIGDNKMQQTLKKNQAEKIHGDNQMVGFFQKVKNKQAAQWSQLIVSSKHTLEQKLHMLQKVDGIFLWKINFQLNRLAVKGISKDALKNRKITLSLPAKHTGETTTDHQKALIEKTIDELEGFENLRLSQFYTYKPVYVEKKVLSEVKRWMEIEISSL
jgi:hypothetical protein